MKKFYIFITFHLLLIVLVGCFADTKSDQDQVASVDELVTGKFVGELKPLGIQTSSNATHLLEQQNGEIIYLYSNFYNLDSERFFGKKVEVRGPVIPGEKREKDTLQVEKLSVVEEDFPSDLFKYEDSWDDGTSNEESEKDRDVDSEESSDDRNESDSQQESDLSEEDDLSSKDDDENKELEQTLGDNSDVSEESGNKDEDLALASNEQHAVISYVVKNIDSIVPENILQPEVSRLEFVEPNYVYVEYSDDAGKKKVLLTYTMEGGNVTDHELIGYFVQGTDKDWDTKSGSNPVSAQPRTVVDVTSSGDVDESFEVEKGYRYFESSSYHFRAQYPSSWYYQGSSGHYSFSSEPVSAENTLVSLDILGEDLESVSGTDENFGEYKGKSVVNDDKITLYIERKKGGVFKIEAGISYEDVVKTMARTIVQE